ncbi:MAG: phosphoribosylanthranilate isomerase [Actinomycetota bacterium]
MTGRSIPWVKVCGITLEKDVEVAITAGADAVGLVVVPESPRAITYDRAAQLAAVAEVETILLTKDLDPEDLVGAAIATGVDGVQPYGRHAGEAAAAAVEVGLRVLRPISVEVDLATIPIGQIPLIDQRDRGLLGGTGVEIDRSLLPATERAYVLAGGLGPNNVALAVRQVRPWGVDASSRLETAPGIKDPQLVIRFVRAAKQA